MTICAIYSTVLSLIVYEGCFTYDFRPDYRSEFSHKIGDYLCIGKIDRKGAFIPNYDKTIRGDRKIFDPEPLVKARWSNELVYEYRTGYLIPMFISGDNRLIPDINSRIIRYEQYRHSMLARRIYNMPGQLIIKPK
jgi:hypothetical protein